MRYIALILLLLFTFGCNRKKAKEKDTIHVQTTVEYAKGFTVVHADGYKEVKIRDPWDSTKYLQNYVLVNKKEKLPEHLPEGTLIRVPLERVVVCTSMHCALLEYLGVEQSIAGVCESRYIDLDFVKQGMREGEIVDIGEAAAPNVELLMDIEPDAIITSPLNSSPYGRVEKTGIPQIKCVDYMESAPLGRAEWIRFISLFFEKAEVADSVFNVVKTAYNGAKDIAATVQVRPTVITEQKIGAIWYVPGGQSYIAHLLRDAGADYVWRENTQSGSVPLSFESVLEAGGDADFWLIKYNRPTDMTYADLSADYSSNAYFSAYKNRNIYTSNTGKVAYYEEVPIRPDFLLKDLIRIFHPELLPDYHLRYYKKMPE